MVQRIFLPYPTLTSLLWKRSRFPKRDQAATQKCRSAAHLQPTLRGGARPAPTTTQDVLDRFHDQAQWRVQRDRQLVDQQRRRRRASLAKIAHVTRGNVW